MAYAGVYRKAYPVAQVYRHTRLAYHETDTHDIDHDTVAASAKTIEVQEKVNTTETMFP
jgi:hypothetical protein